MSLFFPHWGGAKADDWIRFNTDKYFDGLWLDISFRSGAVRVGNVFYAYGSANVRELEEAGGIILSMKKEGDYIDYIDLSPATIEEIFIFHPFRENEKYTHDQIMEKCGL